MRYRILLFLLLTSGAVFGQNKATQLISKKLLQGKTNIDQQSFVLDAVKPLPPNPLRERPVAARLYLSLDTGEDHIVFKQQPPNSNDPYEAINFSVELTCNVTGESISLSIDQDRPEQLIFRDVLSDLQSGAFISGLEISIPQQALKIIAPPGSALETHLNDKLRFRARLEIEYAVDVRVFDSNLQDYRLQDPALIDSKNQAHQNKRVQTFAWDTKGYDYPGWQLQILRLRNTDPDKEGDQNEIKARVDWSKALTVVSEHSDPSLTLTIAEGVGFYIWRVRPVGNFFSGGPANHENYGRWSNAPVDGADISLSKNSPNHPASFYLIDPDEQYNWIYNRIFTEGDPAKSGLRSSEGMAYADALMRVRQNQVYNSANDALLITQNMIDYSGRAALSTIPVPLGGDLDKGYQKSFVLDADNQELYVAKHFDEDNRLQAPAPVKDDDFQNDALAYYSDNNPDQRIPDAEGYAYRRTLYKNDGSGRPAEVSGVGRVHAIGRQTEGAVRTTRYYYMTPSDDELLRLFGDEAPLAESVIKTITIDPNQVATVSYTSKEGNVIATGLATAKTDNLLALSDDLDQFEVNQVLDQHAMQDGRFVTSRRLAFFEDTEISMTYQPAGNPSFGDCISGDCGFRTRLFLTDLGTNKIYRSGIFSDNNELAGITWTELPDASSTFPGQGNKLQLAAGEYLLTKVVFSSKLEEFKNVEDYVSVQVNEQSGNNAAVVIDALSELMGQVNNEADYEAFELTLAALNRNFDKYNHGAAAKKQEGRDSILLLLNLPSATQLPDDFSINYEKTPKDPNKDPANASLSFGTGSCCASATVPITKPEECIPCEEIDSLRNLLPEESDTDFQKIKNEVFTEIQPIVRDTFIKHLARRLIEQNVSLTDVAPGFSFLSLEIMLTNMLISRYYTGKSKKGEKNDNQWYKAVEDENGGLVYAVSDADGNLTPADDNQAPEPITESLPFNYECKDLLYCWLQATRLINAFEVGDDKNVMDEYNDRQGEKESDNHYDDDESRDKEKFSDKILGFIISQKMRKFAKSDEGMATKERMQALVNFPKIFMECAGYQFYRIIDSVGVLDEIGNEYIAAPNAPDDFTSYESLTKNNWIDDSKLKTHGNYAPVLQDADDGGDQEPAQLVYPYMLRPEWMFKYFVYNATNFSGDPDDYIQDVTKDNVDDSGAYLLPNHPSIEIQSCYNPPPCPSDNLCFNPCNYFHKSWSSAQRLQFYKLISYAPVDPNNRISRDNDTLFTVASCEDIDKKDLIAWANLELDVAESACAGRSSEMRAAIIAMIDNSDCYNIVDCDPGSGQVSLKQVDLMVQAAVEACEAKVDSIREKVNNDKDYGYPVCEDKTCYWVQEDYTCVGKTEFQISYFQPCDSAMLEQIQYWEFVPFTIDCPNDQNDVKPENCVDGQYQEYSEEYAVSKND